MSFLPLMIAGGYRVGDRQELEKRTRARLTKEEAEKLSGDRMETFTRKIEEDMRYRQEYARLDPLLPYAPEPNLFLDAAAVWKGSPRGKQLRFGPKGAEFTEMGKQVNRFAADEVEAIFSRKYKDELQRLRRQIQPRDPAGQKTYDEARQEMQEELFAELDVVSQNNRHPVRGVSVLADYEQLNTETDLSRLAASFVKHSRLPQSHAGLTVVADRFFPLRKEKKGVTIGRMKTAFARKIRRGRQLTPSIVEELTTFLKTHPLGTGGIISPALSAPYSSEGPFAGRSYGVASEHKEAVLRQIAIEQERSKWIEAQIYAHKALIDNFRYNSFPLHETLTRLQVSQWTEADGDCGIHALGILFERPRLTRAQLANAIRRVGDVPLANSVGLTGYWLSNLDLAAIGWMLGLGDLAVVTFNLVTNTWAVHSGDPATSQHIIGAVPASVGGSINHWVVLRRTERDG